MFLPLKSHALLIVAILLSNLSFAQKFDFHPSKLDKGMSTLLKYIPVGDSTIYIRENTTVKPIGVKIFRYTFDTIRQELSSTSIPRIEPKNVRKEVHELYDILELGDTHYFVFLDYDKYKEDNHIYSVKLQAFDPATMHPVGEAVQILDKEATINDGYIFVSEGKNHFAILKQNQYSDGGADVYLFKSDDFSLLYKKSFSFATDDKTWDIMSLAIDTEGTVSLISAMKYRFRGVNSQDDLFTELNHTIITTNGEMNTVEIEPEGVLNAELIEVDDEFPFVRLFESDKGKLRISILSAENNGEVIDEREISMEEIINTKSNNFKEKFLAKVEKSEEIWVFLERSAKIDVLSTRSGKNIISYPLLILPKTAFGTNKLYCTIVVAVDKDGTIQWTQLTPFSQSLLTLLDKDGDVHLFGNERSSEFENGIYAGDDHGGPSDGFIPVEITLNGNTGEFISHEKFRGEGVPSDMIFSFFFGGDNFNDNCGFIGVVGQKGVDPKYRNSNISFGLIRLKE